MDSFLIRCAQGCHKFVCTCILPRFRQITCIVLFALCGRLRCFYGSEGHFCCKAKNDCECNEPNSFLYRALALRSISWSLRQFQNAAVTAWEARGRRKWGSVGRSLAVTSSRRRRGCHRAGSWQRKCRQRNDLACTDCCCSGVDFSSRRRQQAAGSCTDCSCSVGIFAVVWRRPSANHHVRARDGAARWHSRADQPSHLPAVDVEL